MIEIPLTSDSAQRFSMNLGGITYSFRVIYNTRANPDLGVWAMDIASGGVDLANGVALVGGSDLMSPYNLELKNLYMVNLTGSTADANASNLGTDVRLFQLTDEEVASVTAV